MSDSILTATGLRKHYRSGERAIEVLRDADLDVSAGESVSIRGESGSGRPRCSICWRALTHRREARLRGRARASLAWATTLWPGGARGF
jgi:predicted ABC-type transport system involved in lysophospholipase L1 biosynthesis ATPase subunit